MSKVVLVTGVAGFVGSNFAKRLIDEGHRVIGIDNMSQGFQRNITSLLNEEGFQFHNVDVRDLDGLKKAAEGITDIVHLAAYKIPRYGGALDTLTINTKGTEHMLEIAREKEGVKVVFSSTSDIYGRNPDVPFSEESASVIGSPQVKRWSYAVSKMFDEQLCFAYAEAYDMPVSVVRYFGGYGPHQNPSWWGGPQAAFMAKILEGETIEIHGDGLQTRSFTYIDDLVEGTYLTMMKDEATGDVFNIGDDREINILQLAQMVWEAAGRSGDVPVDMIPYEHFDKRYEDVRRRVPILEKSERILGFKPRGVLEEDLKTTFAWQQKLFEASSHA